jgi:hypothetical protein
MKHSNKLVMAAVAGMALGASAPAATAQTPLKAGEVACYGVNGCTPESKCAVSKEDLAAVKKLLGAEFDGKFGKSEVHACSGKGQCGAGAHILNWVPSKPADCKTKGGLVISSVKGQKVAKRA